MTAISTCFPATSIGIPFGLLSYILFFLGDLREKTWEWVWNPLLNCSFVRSLCYFKLPCCWPITDLLLNFKILADSSYLLVLSLVWHLILPCSAISKTVHVSHFSLEFRSHDCLVISTLIGSKINFVVFESLFFSLVRVEIAFFAALCALSRNKMSSDLHFG